MDWRELAVTVSSDGEEAVAELFYDLGCPGVNVEDPKLLNFYVESGNWDYHDFGEVALTGTAIVKGYLPEDDELAGKLARLDQELKDLLSRCPQWVVQVKGMTLKEEDWATAWKAYFKPVRVGQHFMIKPTWENVELQPDDVLLEIDPGMAFGTGTHPTTSLCIETIEEAVRPGMKVFDVGTGSGILAVAAAKLGAEVEAVDLDAVAVRVAQENVKLNGMEDRVKVHRGDLGTVLTGKANVVIANIIADVILELIPDLDRLLLPDGDFIASGIIDRRIGDVEKGLNQAGLAVVDWKMEGGWAAIRARWLDRAPV